MQQAFLARKLLLFRAARSQRLAAHLYSKQHPRHHFCALCAPNVFRDTQSACYAGKPRTPFSPSPLLPPSPYIMFCRRNFSLISQDIVSLWLSLCERMGISLHYAAILTATTYLLHSHSWFVFCIFRKWWVFLISSPSHPHSCSTNILSHKKIYLITTILSNMNCVSSICFIYIR